MINHIQVTALRDNVQITTRVAQNTYRKVEGLEGLGMPPGQSESYQTTHGLSLAKDQVVEIDIHDAQMSYFQAAVDAGDISVVVFPAPVTATAQTMSKSAPVTGSALPATSKK